MIKEEREYSKVIPYDVAGGVNLKLYKKKLVAQNIVAPVLQTIKN